MYRSSLHLGRSDASRLISLLNSSNVDNVLFADDLERAVEKDPLLRRSCDATAMFAAADSRGTGRLAAEDIARLCDLRIPRLAEQASISLQWMLCVEAVLGVPAGRRQHEAAAKDFETYCRGEMTMHMSAKAGQGLSMTSRRRTLSVRALPTPEHVLLARTQVRGAAEPATETGRQKSTAPLSPAASIIREEPPRRNPAEADRERSHPSTRVNNWLSRQSAAAADEEPAPVVFTFKAKEELMRQFEAGEVVVRRPDVTGQSVLLTPPRPSLGTASRVYGTSVSADGSPAADAGSPGAARHGDFVTKFHVPTIHQQKVHAAIHEKLAQEAYQDPAASVFRPESEVPEKFVTAFRLNDGQDMRVAAVRELAEIESEMSRAQKPVLQPYLRAERDYERHLRHSSDFRLNFRRVDHQHSLSSAEPLFQAPEPLPERVMQKNLQRKAVALGFEDPEKHFFTAFKTLRPSDKLQSLGHHVDFAALHK